MVRTWLRPLSVLLLAAALLLPARAGEEAEAQPPLRHVILLIADGAGFAHFEAASLYRTGRRGTQACYAFPVRLAMSNYPAGGSYDPVRAVAAADTVRRGATDSAAAITAMLCGVKTKNGVLGLDAAGRRQESVVERMDARGMATGVVTTVPFTHATPAGAVAHVASRNDYGTIARQMLFESGLDVVMGAGHPDFDDDGKRREGAPDLRYLGDEATWERARDGGRWTLVTSRDGIRALAEGPAPKRLLGIAPVAATLQERRSGNPIAPPFAVPATPGLPTLAEMTAAALNVLDDDSDGFFLMVEGGAVDWAAHQGRLGRLIEEQIDFDAATDTVLAWVEDHEAWSDTLVIVTADHECGFLTGPEQPAKEGAPPWWLAPIESNGAGRLPHATLRSKGHTNQLVPFFAKGAFADRFARLAAGTHDPVRGPYFDNVAVARVIEAALDESPTGNSRGGEAGQR